jgi:hypothetical protein
VEWSIGHCGHCALTGGVRELESYWLGSFGGDTAFRFRLSVSRSVPLVSPSTLPLVCLYPTGVLEQGGRDSVTELVRGWWKRGFFSGGGLMFEACVCFCWSCMRFKTNPSIDSSGEGWLCIILFLWKWMVSASLGLAERWLLSCLGNIGFKVSCSNYSDEGFIQWKLTSGLFPFTVHASTASMLVLSIFHGSGLLVGDLIGGNARTSMCVAGAGGAVQCMLQDCNRHTYCSIHMVSYICLHIGIV